MRTGVEAKEVLWSTDHRFCARREDSFFDGSRAFVTSRVLLPRGFLRGRRCRRRMRERRLGDRASENAPHPHFVSPSPRKKTRGEGLSTGKMLWLRLCRPVVTERTAICFADSMDTRLQV